MRRLAQSTAYTVVFKLFLSSDHVSAATGKTVAITISKAGAAFGNPNAGASNATEISGGWYKFALDTTDTGTLGDLILVGTVAACDTADIPMQVVSATTGGATNLDGTVSSRASQTSVDDLPTNAELATALGTADDAVLAQIALVKGQTDLIPSDPADASVIAARFDTLDTSVADLPTNAELATALGTADDATLAAIAALSIPTALQNADALLDRASAIEAGVTPRGALRLASAMLGGKVSGAGTGTETFRNAVADSKDRLVITDDINGNRTAVVADLT